MGFYSFLAVGGGATFGAWLRWWLGILLNPVFPTLPLGTLADNLIGGYLVGVAVAFFSEHAGLSPEARLFVITGFMGGFTTFSTFSMETLLLAEEGEVLKATTYVALSITLGLLAVFSGAYLARTY